MYICKNGNKILADLPRWEGGACKGKINRELMVGMCFDVEYRGEIYKDIKILEYIPAGKHARFTVQYNDKILKKSIDCASFLSGSFNSILNTNLNNIKNTKEVIDDIVHIHIKNTKGEEFEALYSGNHVEEVMKSTWYVNINKHGKVKNVQSSNYNGSHAFLHRVDFDLKNGNIVEHINNNPLDNRDCNLRIVNTSCKNKNTNNIWGLTGLKKYNNSWRSAFVVDSIIICTKIKHDLEEAKLDNLIAQQYLGYKHNEELFYLLDNLSEERIKEVTNLLDEKIERNKNKILEQKEYNHDIEEKDGYYILHWNGEEMLFDCDLEFIKNMRINKVNGYWYCGFIENNIKLQNRFHRELLTLRPEEYKDYNIQVDHLNNNPSDNRMFNLIISTVYSNQCNKQSKGYRRLINGNYIVEYMSNYKFRDIINVNNGVRRPSFKTEQEAINEVNRRKQIIENSRVKLKSKEELEELMTYCLNNNYILENGLADLDLGYLYWKNILNN